jgi:hypothetical protein
MSQPLTGPRVRANSARIPRTSGIPAPETDAINPFHRGEPGPCDPIRPPARRQASLHIYPFTRQIPILEQSGPRVCSESELFEPIEEVSNFFEPLDQGEPLEFSSQVRAENKPESPAMPDTSPSTDCSNQDIVELFPASHRSSRFPPRHAPPVISTRSSQIGRFRISRVAIRPVESLPLPTIPRADKSPLP